MKNMGNRESEQIFVLYIFLSVEEPQKYPTFYKALQNYRATRAVRLFDDISEIKAKMSESERKEFEEIWSWQLRELQECVHAFNSLSFDKKEIKLALQSMGQKIKDLLKPMQAAFEAKIKDEEALLSAEEQS